MTVNKREQLEVEKRSSLLSLLPVQCSFRESGIEEAVAPQMELQPGNNIIGLPLMEQVVVVVGDQKNKKVVMQHQPDEGNCSLLGPTASECPVGLYDKPLSCFGCGIGWFSFIFGFVFPPLWYYATFLYFGNYYIKDPRERAGLAASAIAALICSAAVLISLLAVFC